MNKIALLIVCGICVVTSGCSQKNAQRNMIAKYPNGKIVNVPGHPYEWLVNDGTNIVYMSDYGVDQTIATDVIPLFSVGPE